MQLDEFKKRMAELDKTLAKTDRNLRINVEASTTGQTKLLEKFRQSSISGIIIAIILGVVMLGLGIGPSKISMTLKILLVVFVAIAGVWYGFLFYRLRNINIGALPPATLLAKTARFRLLVITGEVFFMVYILLMMLYAWFYNPDGFWAMAAAPVICLVLFVKKYWPEYRQLFREMNTLEE